MPIGRTSSSGIEENFLPLRLLAVLEENIARNSEGLAQALFDRAVEKILAPAEVFLRPAALRRFEHQNERSAGL